MAWENRKTPRVNFENGVAVQMMAIDGTWRRDCTMRDASDGGAKLTVNGSLEGLELKEFFLLLSSTGLVYRRCRLVRLQGDEIGVEFIKPVGGEIEERRLRKDLTRDLRRRAPFLRMPASDVGFRVAPYLQSRHDADDPPNLARAPKQPRVS
jgi:hypothetical protein